jgi:Helix-turn-helix domain
MPPYSLAFLFDEDRSMAKRSRSPYLTAAEAAEFLRLKAHTLENMRSLGTGPKFRKHGGRILYHRTDLRIWSDRGRRLTSSGRRQ